MDIVRLLGGLVLSENKQNEAVSRVSAF